MKKTYYILFHIVYFIFGIVAGVNVTYIVMYKSNDLVLTILSLIIYFFILLGSILIIKFYFFRFFNTFFENIQNNKRVHITIVKDRKSLLTNLKLEVFDFYNNKKIELRKEPTLKEVRKITGKFNLWKTTDEDIFLLGYCYFKSHIDNSLKLKYQKKIREYKLRKIGKNE